MPDGGCDRTGQAVRQVRLPQDPWAGAAGGLGDQPVGSGADLAARGAQGDDGSCIRLRAERPGHVWSYDFVEDITHNERKYRMLNIIDEYSRECLAMVPQRRFRSDDVLAVLADVFVEHGPPEHIRSDNGPAFAARAVRDWLGKGGVKTLFIEPGSPWENGYIESFNARLRNELLDGEIFYTLEGVRVISGWGREHSNKIRPQSALGNRPPAPQAILPRWPISTAALRRSPTLAAEPAMN